MMRLFIYRRQSGGQLHAPAGSAPLFHTLKGGETFRTL